MRIEYNTNLVNNRKNILRRVTKVTEEMLHDVSYLKPLLFSTKKKGFRLFLLSVEIGYDGDDFVKNLQTILLTYKAYKKPRFIK